MRVVVAMSGGVDSSAVAGLLMEAGHEVIGVTLKLWPQDCVSRAEDKCCGPQAVMDARSVCAQLGVPYYMVDESAEFQRTVIGYFADAFDRKLDGNGIKAIGNGWESATAERAPNVKQADLDEGILKISSDGKAARQAVSSKDSPVRWLVVGVVDG